MRKGITLGVFALMGAHAAFGSLMSIGPVPLSGAGLGSQNTVLTFTSPANTTTESGCVAGGIGGVTVTGPTACPAGFTGGDEQAINNTFSATALGLTDFNNLQIIFNAAEPNSAAQQSITLTNLALTLWDPATGLILDARYIPGSIDFPNAFPGVGNAGFGFQLDTAQAGAVNGILAAFPDLLIGISATADNATGGLETVSVRTVAALPSPVPEPSTYALAGSALMALYFVRRKRA
jgi:hypothetical protein